MSDAPTVRKNMSDGTRRFVIHTGKLDGAFHASYMRLQYERHNQLYRTDPATGSDLK